MRLHGIYHCHNQQWKIVLIITPTMPCQALDKADGSHVKPTGIVTPPLINPTTTPDLTLLFCRPSPRSRMIWLVRWPWSSNLNYARAFWLFLARIYWTQVPSCSSDPDIIGYQLQDIITNSLSASPPWYRGHLSFRRPRVWLTRPISASPPFPHPIIIHPRHRCSDNNSVSLTPRTRFKRSPPTSFSHSQVRQQVKEMVPVRLTGQETHTMGVCI